MYSKAWAPYVWPVSGVGDLKVAPFHFLASEGRVWFDLDHLWHMGLADRLAVAADAVVTRTQWRPVALGDESAVRDAVGWWETITDSGSEGTVVKPREFVARGKKGLIQLALKVRCREYLRIVYGPEYDAPENLVRRRGGMLKMEWKRFLFFNALGGALWVWLWTLTGFYLGEHVSDVKVIAHDLEHAGAILGIGVLIAAVIYGFWRLRHAS